METGMLLKELMNASMNAEEIPEVTFGRTTLKNAAPFGHPRLHAASSMEKSNCSIEEPTTRITYGSVTMKCPAKSPANTGIRSVRIRHWYMIKPITIPGTIVGERKMDFNSCFPFDPALASA